MLLLARTTPMAYRTPHLPINYVRVEYQVSVFRGIGVILTAENLSGPSYKLRKTVWTHELVVRGMLMLGMASKASS